jgi:hypothetical protein
MHPDPSDMQLDSAKDDQVSSHRVLDIFLGTPPSRMLIFTGIAMPEWRSTGTLVRKRVWVNFGYHAQHIIGYTAVAGLAGIQNEDDEPFGFWTDTASVELRDDNGELALVCDIAALADPGRLRRFAYQASVIIEVHEPLIAGTIRWHSSLTTMQRQTDLFKVHGLFVETVSITEGLQPQSIVHTVGNGQETEPPTLTGDYFLVPYVLRDNLPLNLGITVSVDAEDGAFSKAPQDLAFVQVAGPRPTILTPAQPQVFGVDFEMVDRDGVR